MLEEEPPVLCGHGDGRDLRRREAGKALGERLPVGGGILAGGVVPALLGALLRRAVIREVPALVEGHVPGIPVPDRPEREVPDGILDGDRPRPDRIGDADIRKRARPAEEREAALRGHGDGDLIVCGVGGGQGACLRLAVQGPAARHAAVQLPLDGVGLGLPVRAVGLRADRPRRQHRVALGHAAVAADPAQEEVSAPDRRGQRVVVVGGEVALAHIRPLGPRSSRQVEGDGVFHRVPVGGERDLVSPVLHLLREDEGAHRLVHARAGPARELEAVPDGVGHLQARPGVEAAGSLRLAPARVGGKV